MEWRCDENIFVNQLNEIKDKITNRRWNYINENSIMSCSLETMRDLKLVYSLNVGFMRKWGVKEPLPTRRDGG